LFKEKHDGYPAVCVCKDGMIHMFKLTPEGHYENMDGPIPGGSFPGYLQIEVMEENAVRTYQYIDYNDGSADDFPGRRDKFVRSITPDLGAMFAYTYGPLTYEKFQEFIKPEIEGVVIQRKHAAFGTPSFPTSYYVKHCPTVDLNFSRAVEAGFKGDEFLGIGEFSLTGEFVRFRRDKVRPNSYDEVKKVEAIVPLLEALVGLWDGRASFSGMVDVDKIVELCTEIENSEDVKEFNFGPHEKHVRVEDLFTRNKRNNAHRPLNKPVGVSDSGGNGSSSVLGGNHQIDPTTVVFSGFSGANGGVFRGMENID